MPPGARYIDHASGANRGDKSERDIRLLEAALEREPDNARYWFYLAWSYRDAGQYAEAAATFAKRAETEGWDEEAWMARLQHARCLRDPNSRNWPQDPRHPHPQFPSSE
ncbi:tetratricopeptide repeat protein [Bradyrhizobium sp. ma5]|uniref:tetratricopeptide repeat protein n=1 Tax=Bradyrhizobium sp. ma5 TaxID=3344828 RepID=UPI0035D4757C